MAKIDYNREEIRVITIELSQWEYERGILEYARAKVNAEKVANVTGWGGRVDKVAWRFVDETETEKYAVVTFRRRVDNDTSE